MVNSSNKRSSASLRIISTKLSIEDISKAMGFEPDKSFVMGTNAVLNNPKTYIRKENLWIVTSSLDPSEKLEAHIAELVKLIELKISILEDILTTSDIDLFCGFSSMAGQGGFTLSPELLKRLTILPIKLIMDLYPPESVTEDESDFIK
jgi:Domain of unknown function (DUF4279)